MTELLPLIVCALALVGLVFVVCHFKKCRWYQALVVVAVDAANAALFLLSILAVLSRRQSRPHSMS